MPFQATVKILGVHFTYDLRAKQKLNVDELISSIQEKLQIWRWRDLTIIGRIQIVKTFIIPILKINHDKSEIMLLGNCAYTP